MLLIINYIVVKMGCAESQEGQRCSDARSSIASVGNNTSNRSRGIPTTYKLSTTAMSINDFRIEKVIGRGGCGKVMLVRKRDTEKMYAMKMLKKEEV